MCSMMDYFFISNKTQELKIGDHVALTEDESHHAIRVLRKKEGDFIGLLNGAGFVGKGKITEPHKKNCTVEITFAEVIDTSPLIIDLFVGFPKGNDRIEWMLEKSCECGVHSITPIICEHSERKKYNTERGEKILKAACKQSGNPFLPQLHEPKGLKDAIAKTEQEILYAHCFENKKRHKISDLSNKENLKTSVFIGPEGDFSESEIVVFEKRKATPITLGNLRLRTETAVIASIIQLLSLR